MKLLFQVLLLVVIVALQKCQNGWNPKGLNQDGPADYYDIKPPRGDGWNTDILNEEDEEFMYNIELETPTPNITVCRQMEDREHDSVIVLCMFDPMLSMSWQTLSFELSVESELNYSKKMEKCNREMCVFMVTVSPPASFTCVHKIHFDGEVKYLHSQTYNYSKSVSDHHGVSLFCIGFSSFIAVGFVIVTVALIVTTIRSKAKDPINPTSTVTDNDYMDA